MHSLAHACSASRSVRSRGQYDEAIVHLQKAVELDPGDAQVHFLLGSGLQGALSLDEAVAEYRKSLAINGHNGAAHNNLGLILFRERHYDAARGELFRALEEDGNDVPPPGSTWHCCPTRCTTLPRR